MSKEGSKTFDWLPPGKELLADGEYDVIVLGTGLKECILSGLLAVKGYKILHLDRNNYYGGECASLNLTHCYEKFNLPLPDDISTLYGASRDYNIDLIPKFIMACGNLVKMLLHTKVTRYLEFKNVDGSYVYKGSSIYKVPATAEEALRTSLMGIFEKRRFRKMLIYISNVQENNRSTFEGIDVFEESMRKVYEKFGVDQNTQSFTGHAMALMRDESYLDKPAIETIRAIQMYAYSLERYGKSPYLYPIYGLGSLPESFSRLCAIHGGIFMLNRSVDRLLFDDNTGKAVGIECDNMMAKASFIIGDPSYFPSEKLQKTGEVIRSIFILDHPIPNTNHSESCQIIIPAPQANRQHDIYVCAVSSPHCVSAEGFYIAIISTTVETSTPKEEIEVGINLLGGYLQRFDNISSTYKPMNDSNKDQCYITTSYDATSHFETTAEDVLQMYKQITGEELDMSINADTTQVDEE